MKSLSCWLAAASAVAFVVGGSLVAEAQEIKLWTLNFANDSANKAFQEIVKQFESANPGETVKVETRGVDEHKSALRVAAGSSQGPDIFFSWPGSVSVENSSSPASRYRWTSTMPSTSGTIVSCPRR